MTMNFFYPLARQHTYNLTQEERDPVMSNPIFGINMVGQLSNNKSMATHVTISTVMYCKRCHFKNLHESDIKLIQKTL